MSRCHGDAVDSRPCPCELAYNKRPTNQQTFGSASRQVLAVQPNTNRQAPRCLDNFPCNQTGAAEACAGPESCCGSAAPTASPRTLFQRLLRCVTAHKRLVVLSSRVSSVQNSPDRQTRRAGGSSIYQDWLDMLREGCGICQIIGSKFYISIFLSFEMMDGRGRMM